MVLTYYATIIFLFQFGVFAKTLSIQLPDASVILDEQRGGDFGSTWTGTIQWQKQFGRSVEGCQDFAGTIAQAVITAVQEEERNRDRINGDENALTRNFGGDGGYGNLLFSVYTDAKSKFAFVASIPRGFDARKVAWKRIHDKAPLLSKAIRDLGTSAHTNRDELHGEEVAYSLLEESGRTSRKTNFKDQNKRPASTEQPGYLPDSVVGSWLITKRQFQDATARKGTIQTKKTTLGDRKPACEANTIPRTNNNQGKKRTACTIISNELGVRTLAKGPTPIAGSETAKIRGEGPVLKKPKPGDGCDEVPSTGVQPRAKSCPLQVKSITRPPTTATDTAIVGVKSSGKPAVSGMYITSANSIFSGKVVISGNPAVSAKSATGKGKHSTGRHTTMQTLIKPPKMAAATKADHLRPAKPKNTATQPTRSKHSLKKISLEAI